MLSDGQALSPTPAARLRVTMVSGSLPEMSCGVGDYAARLAVALGSEGIAVRVVTSQSHRIDPLDNVQVDPEVKTWGMIGLPRLLRAIRRTRSPIVHVQYPTVGYRHGLGPLLMVPLLRVLAPQMRVVVTLHEYRHSAVLHRVYMAAFAPLAHRLITPDRTQLKGMPLGVPGRAIEIPLASNLEPVATSAHRAGRELVVGTWGFLRPDKGIDRLIDAFANVAQERPARLVIAGDPGPDAAYAAEIRTRVAASPVRGRISFTGQLPEGELSQTLARFDVCVLPYVAGLEANRGTYLAARSHGLSIVTTTLSEPRFDGESNTTFVRAGDGAALVRAILEAGARPRLASASTVGDWGSIARQHLAVYSELIAPRIGAA